MKNVLIVFVHGWSVTHTDTYGDLPQRLQADARRAGLAIEVAHVFLGRYVSFRDEVGVEDIARAFDAEITRVLRETGGRRRFVCITHSTGGPVVREWLDRYHAFPRGVAAQDVRCPMSHLIMLAPANFGSALAQIGKERIGRLKAWFNGIEPGRRVLDWLELASPEAMALNLRWIRDYGALGLERLERPVFQFVLTGDRIDRKLYDHVNSYTGETGSDGVVRVAAANLNATHVVLRQPAAPPGLDVRDAAAAIRELQVESVARSPATPLKIVPGASHSGKDMGIMRSVRSSGEAPVVDAILRCMQIEDAEAYALLAQAFDAENLEHQRERNRLEIERIPLLPDRVYIHDPHAMLILRITDDRGIAVGDADIVLTGGENADPNRLPRGFLTDRQGNRRRAGSVSFYMNHAVLAGSAAITDARGAVVRAALATQAPYGLEVSPPMHDRFVEHWPAALSAPGGDLLRYLRPNETTIVDVVLARIVREGVFRLAPGFDKRSFKRDKPGGAV